MLVEVILLVLLVIIIYYYDKKPSNFPPGFWGFPGIGYIPLSGKSVLQTLEEGRKKYGNTFIWRLGTMNFLFIFDFPTIKKVLSSTEGADRPDIAFSKLVNPHKAQTGIVGSNGEFWQHIRRFSLSQLRQLGMGKSFLVQSMEKEVKILLEELDKTSGISGAIPSQLKIAITNVSWLMVANERFDVNDGYLTNFQENVEKLVIDVEKAMIPDFFPWIKWFLPDYLMHKIFFPNRKDTTDAMKKIVLEVIESHKKNLDRLNPKDFIDAYLIEMEKSDQDRNPAVTEQNLFDVVADLYVGSSETQVVTFRWTLLYIAAYPEIQRKLHEELDRLLPGQLMPDADSQAKFHYTKAIIAETHRHSNAFPSGAWRSLSRDTTINGYLVPKGTIIPTMTESAHFDPRYWENPTIFLPERHLDSQGVFVPPKEGFVPFGVGKRYCPGEGIARVQLVIFLAGMMKNFRISPVPGKEISLEPEFDTLIARYPDMSQHVIIEKRH